MCNAMMTQVFHQGLVSVSIFQAFSFGLDESHIADAILTWAVLNYRYGFLIVLRLERHSILVQIINIKG